MAAGLQDGRISSGSFWALGAVHKGCGTDTGLGHRVGPCPVRLLRNSAIATAQLCCATEAEGIAHVVMVYAVIRGA